MPGDIHLISSSPPRRFATYNLSSSPLPALQDITMEKAPVLRTGSQAAAIPQYAAASFTTASSLLTTSLKSNVGVESIPAFSRDCNNDNGSAQRDEGESAKPRGWRAAGKNEGKILKKPRKTTKKDAADGEPKKPRKTTKKDPTDGGEEPNKARKPRAKGGDDAVGKGAEAKEPKPRKPRAKKTVDRAEEDAVPKEPNPRKQRAKKGDTVAADGDEPLEKPVRKRKVEKTRNDETQNKLPQGQIIKASITPKSKSAGATKTKGKTTADGEDPFADSMDFGLVEAVRRRTNWTPPPPTHEPVFTSADAVGASNTPEFVDVSTSVEAKNGFTDLLGNFGFAKPEAPVLKVTVVEGTRKRKLIELVNTTISTTFPALKTKVAKVAKKPRTITEQATSAYAEGDGDSAAPLLQYFSMQTTERITKDGFKTPAKPRSKSPTKLKPSYKGSAPTLLSPASALQQVGKQDFVFGTSSQLARENSPTLLRDLHQALQASNELDDGDPFADSPAGERQGTSKLWAASARIENGNLMDVDTVDLIDSPANGAALVLPLQLTPKTNNPTQEDVDKSIWLELDGSDFPSSPVQISKQASSQEVGPIEAAIRAEILSSPPRIQNTGRFKAATPKKSSTPRKPGRPAAKLLLDSLQKPNFDSYTTAQLTKQIASYRFKPVKSRDAMIELLEKCWQGKHQPALGVLDANQVIKAKSAKKAVSQADESATSPKRPRGRSRKDSTSTASPKVTKAQKAKKVDTVQYLDIDSDTPLSQIRTPRKTKKKATGPEEDISASDAELTPSPRRRGASKSKRLPRPLKLSSSASSSSTTTLEDQASLLKHITSAVKSAPPSLNPKEPSWHEKILLYDPIIIEDLTTWLNGGKLSEVGWDGEVDVREVKKWCEGNSICCLWRENLRGGTRGRY